ncbi:hypothetical protein [Thiofaba sp. EF100]|uniref:hypothetical protein n=1 Tax=Thiofaba sp. EF100 TaxID=3121274 RepID=UPI003221A2AA
MRRIFKGILSWMLILIGGAALFACGGGGSTYDPYMGATPPGSLGAQTGVAGEVNRIEWVKSEPALITLRGVGGLPDVTAPDPEDNTDTGYLQQTSKVTFRVVDKNGLGVSNQMVSFGLDTYVGGLALSDAAKKTDGNGFVYVVVSSGSVSTPIWLTATIAGRNDIPAQSVKLVVTTGVPTQESFTVGPDVLNPEAYDIVNNASPVKITVNLSDRNRNQVADGTAVVFMAEGGQIGDSCLTHDGKCTVQWVGARPLPTDGRVNILAFAIGEESFRDIDSDGYKDPNESWTDIGEAFLDENENGRWDGEPYRDFNSNGQYDGEDGVYTGWLCDPNGSQGLDGDEGLCPGRHSLHVFGNMTLVAAESNAAISHSVTGSVVTLSVSGYRTHQVMPYGTTITVTPPPGATATPASFTVPNTLSTGPGKTVFTFTASGAGLYQVEVKTPSGAVTAYSFTL